VPIRAAAVPAWLRLQAELSDADSVPCREQQSSHLWTSEQPEEREAATYRCTGCPVVDACGNWATAAKEKVGVWPALIGRLARRPPISRGRTDAKEKCP